MAWDLEDIETGKLVIHYPEDGDNTKSLMEWTGNMDVTDETLPSYDPEPPVRQEVLEKEAIRPSYGADSDALSLSMKQTDSEATLRRYPTRTYSSETDAYADARNEPSKEGSGMEYEKKKHSDGTKEFITGTHKLRAVSEAEAEPEVGEEAEEPVQKPAKKTGKKKKKQEDSSERRTERKSSAEKREKDEPSGAEPERQSAFRGIVREIPDDEEEELSMDTWKGKFLRFLMRLAVLAVVLYLAFTFVFGLYFATDNRMYPFLMDGDILITYRLGTYQTGDAIVYKDPDTGKNQPGRIVARGVNEISINEEGQLVVDGSVSEVPVYGPTIPAEDSQISLPYSLSSQGFFVMNDARENTSDSRVFGELTRGDFNGKIIYVIRTKGI
ncbi:MAG: signal peptidase I [Solobacterium sp.]|nr:signal peptidase I [Solobacterium sp.]